jgi:hypothetical protein
MRNYGKIYGDERNPKLRLVESEMPIDRVVKNYLKVDEKKQTRQRSNWNHS